MKIAFYSAKQYDRDFFDMANRSKSHELTYFSFSLEEKTVGLAEGYDAICVFVNDIVNDVCLEKMASFGIKVIALRCAGFNNVDLEAAEKFGIKVVRVPAYSPHSVAEHTLALVLSLNRKIHRAYNRVREGNFSIEGLMGYDLNGLTAGVIGTGKIGECVSQIFKGFGCKVIAFDPTENENCLKIGVKYVGLDQLLSEADIITLHCPLTAESHHLINKETIKKIKDDAMLINTSRGGLIDTVAITKALKKGKIGSLGIDVYEEEGDLFFKDMSGQVIQDDVFARLTTFPNVIITGHQAFFTQNALRNISDITLSNISEIESKGASENEVFQ